jgi:hypothetical protein
MPGLASIYVARANSGPNFGIWRQVGYRWGVNDQGAFQEYTERGPVNLVILDALDYFIPNGWTTEVSNEKAGLSTLTARAGWYGTPGQTDYANEVAGDIWEMEPSRSDKPLLGADFPFGTVNMNIGPDPPCLGSAGSRLAIQAAIADNNPLWISAEDNENGIATLVLSSGTQYIFDSGFLADYQTYQSSCPTADYPIARTLYKIMQAGTTSFPVTSRTIKHTKLFSSQYNTLASYNNVDRIISSAGMVNIEGCNPQDPAVWTVPQSPAPGQYIVTPGDLQYGWQKETPEVSRISQCKWRTVNRYQFGLWLKQLYGQAL